MFRNKTLFVIGAGANAGGGNEGLRMPTGPELKRQISKALDLKFEHGFRLVSGDDVIAEVLRNQNGQGSTGAFGVAARFISNAMPQAISIDNFVDAHRSDEKVSLCAKLAIVRCILSAERGGPLYISPEDEPASMLARTSLCWLAEFFRYLTENVSKAELRDALSMAAVVSFNYDRCIEHYLPHAIKNYYGMELAEATSVAKSLVILHPYGSVGLLPGSDRADCTVAFGRNIERIDDLLKLAEGIKTFSERLDDDTFLAAIKMQVACADTVVFLGFAFHRLNLRLLETETLASRVYATAYGFSDPDRKVLTEELSSFFTKAVTMELRGDLKGHEFFDQYKRSLS